MTIPVIILSANQAFALYSEAVGLNLFPSLWQRSVRNEPGLTAAPWWSVKDTGYMPDFTRIEKSMDNITRYVVWLHIQLEGAISSA